MSSSWSFTPPQILGIEYHDWVDSTQKIARRRLQELSYHGKISQQDWVWILAKEQTEGEGSRKRVWHSFVGGFYGTLIVSCPRVFSPFLALVGALGVIKTLKNMGIASRLKWINDVYVSDKKIGGVLAENWGPYQEVSPCLLGIGVNVNNLCTLPSAVAMNTLLHKDISLHDFFCGLHANVVSTFQQLYTHFDAFQQDIKLAMDLPAEFSNALQRVYATDFYATNHLS